MKEISILLPTFNDPCLQLVQDLQRQASMAGIRYEIVVGDDGSTMESVLQANRAVNRIKDCHMIEFGVNHGRAAIRNLLAQQARYPWLLFIDSDMVVSRDDFLLRYATYECDTVVDGGIVVGPARRENLRSLYEKASELKHSAARRREAPYQDFHTANFLVRRDIMLSCPFDERFRHYGYEDVLFGKAMQQRGISIHHIDNPVSFEVFETNSHFLDKTEEGLRTLFQFRNELKGYSRLIDTADALPRWPIRLWHRLFAKCERRQLEGTRPSLLLFHLYKIGYYVSLHG